MEDQRKQGNSCSLCGNHRRLFELPALFCSGTCGMQRICRNAIYFTDRFKQNYWCERCHSNLNECQPIPLDDGRQTKKSKLLKLRNDATPEEAWIQCDSCHAWNHQVCALFNGPRNAKNSSYKCPQCILKLRDGGTQENSEDKPIIKDARDLPHCNLSKSIEDGLQAVLLKEYEKVAETRLCEVAQVEKAEGLCVRVVSKLEKKHKVREEVSHLFCIVRVALM